MQQDANRNRRNAIVTASYAGDFERFKVLCETIDARVSGYEQHYVLVEPRDVALFKPLETSRRIIVDERDILPSWLKALPDPMKLGRRSVWLSHRTLPLHGWHVQQLRRIAIADHIAEEGLLYCDSDTAFVREFDLGELWRDDKLRFFRHEHGIRAKTGDQRRWVDEAGFTLGIEPKALNDHDYVEQLVTWRASRLRAMCRHIEAVHGRHWLSVIGRSRKFSECMIYGHYLDDVRAGDGHFIAHDSLCEMQWFAPPPTPAELLSFVAESARDKVAVGIQSFLPLDMRAFRRAVGV